MKGKGDRTLSAGTRLELLAIGIPDREHSVDALATRFPAEFKIREANFDLDTLAKVLVHLVRSGIVKFPARTAPSGRKP